ncbi:MAG: transcriptional regulator [Bacteroidota bacterium]
METITLPDDVMAFCMRATSFPEGIQQAHRELHGVVPFDMHRSYYGISRPEGGPIVYRAGATELYESELSPYKLETFLIKKGQYLCIDVPGYMLHLDRIGSAFKELLADGRIDSNGACIEWYIDEQLCKCIVRMEEHGR